MSQTPQPEESPDEILASEIAEAKERVDRYNRLINNFPEDSFESDLDEAKQDVAMLEAMRALRGAVQEYATSTHYNGYEREIHDCCMERVDYGHHEKCSAMAALRQSDDAIRGMRG